MLSGEEERRTARRRQVGLPVECRNGKSVATGIVRDITPDGVFMASDRDGVPRGTQVRPASSLEQFLQVGERFVLTFIQTSVMNSRTTTATVRWQGISNAHGCYGYGVQYERE